MTALRPADAEIAVPAWVDGALRPMGKLEVHREGIRHKAVSVFVLAGSRLLIQRRAAAKYHCGGLWANTCCTHPLWGEDGADCAARRLGEEMGLTGIALERRPTIEYRAAVGGGMVEHEVVEVFLGHVPRPVDVPFDPAEVDAARWVSLPVLGEEVAEAPNRFTPWMRIYMRDHLDRILGDAAPLRA